jgi:hypothetical protein
VWHGFQSPPESPAANPAAAGASLPATRDLARVLDDAAPAEFGHSALLG